MINSQVKTACLESDLCYTLLMKRVWDCRLSPNLTGIVTDNVLEFKLKGYIIGLFSFPFFYAFLIPRPGRCGF